MSAGARWFALAALCLLSWASGARADGPQCPLSARCEPLGAGHDEHTFRVDGTYLYMKFADGDYFSMKCEGNLTLESPALPRFESTLRVNQSALRGCPVPRGSYGAVMSALNVLVLQKLEVEGARGELAAEQLAGLGRVRALALVRLRLAPGLWRAVPQLLRLRLEAARPALLGDLPPALEELHLVEAGVSELPRGVLARLTALAALTVRAEAEELRVEPGAPLRSLALQARAVWLPAELPPTLERLTLDGWAERAPPPWASCGALEVLELEGAAAERLPADWVRACPRLRSLVVRGAAGLRTLAPGALRGAGALLELWLAGGALAELPAGLLDDAANLTTLSLSGNRLRALPSGLLSQTRVQDLRLDGNRLAPPTWDALASLHQLRVLQLSHNTPLGDACAGGLNALRGTSKLLNLRQLRKLYLRNITATVICRDWREHMPHLADLDLRDNRIPFVTYRDLQFEGGAAAGYVRVQLGGNPLRALVYTRAEHALLLSRPAEYCRAGGGRTSRARVLLAGELACDCGVLWAARTLRECPEHVRVEGARCGPAPGRALADVPPAALTCPLARDVCGAPAGCECSSREAARGLVWRVTCVGLAVLPRLDAREGVAWELILPHNRVSQIDDLPAPLLELDLRYNNVTHVPQRALDALGARASLLLDGNPLSCECDAAPHVRALLRRTDLVTDELRCAGAPLAVPRRCEGRAQPAAGAPAPLLALAGALAAGAALGALSLALPNNRRRLKALWSRARVGAAPSDEAEAEAEAEAALPYDVFLSFSHEDEAAAERLLAWLEARRYRVCVHWRDWAPGGWIPAQIAASVRRSRRTLALVSRAFLRSGWALAELREAHAAALADRAAPAARLVVVLLEAPAGLPLGPELRRYLEHNTYALWGERYFWTKLRAALPPPPPEPPPGPETPAPLPAPEPPPDPAPPAA